MRDLLEAGVRLFGCGVLFVLTAGRYRGPYTDGLLAEGGAGLAAVALGTFLFYAFMKS